MTRRSRLREASGVTDMLTLEAHAEATGGLVDAGGGALVRLGMGGVLSGAWEVTSIFDANNYTITQPQGITFNEAVVGGGVTVFFTNGGEVMGRLVKEDKIAGEQDGAIGGK